MRESARATLGEAAVQSSGASLYQLEDWREEFGVTAGVSAGTADFDLNLGTDPPSKQTIERWQALRGAAGKGFSAVVVSRQVHGTRVDTHEQVAVGLHIRSELDGHVTCQTGLLLAVTVADCVPVYLLHPESGALGLLHAGWRGIAAGILQRGMETLIEISRGTAQDLVMHCGIGICGSCYEVGPEVVEAVTGRHTEHPERVDLRATLRAQARDLGIGRVTLSPWCTAHDHERFFSHRGSGGDRRRMAAFLGRAQA